MKEKYIKLRDARGMTDAQVARETGIPVTTLYSFVKSDRKDVKLSVDNAKRIAKLFNVTLDFLAE